MPFRLGQPVVFGGDIAATIIAVNEDGTYALSCTDKMGNVSWEPSAPASAIAAV